MSIYESVHPVHLENDGSSSLSVFSVLDERDCHYHTLQAIRSFFNNLSRFHPSSWAGFPFHFWAHAVRCASILLRLSIPASHRDEIRKQIDVLTVVDWISQKIQEAAVYIGETASEGLFGLLHRVSRSMRAHMASKLEPISEQPGLQAPVSFMEMPTWGNDMGIADPSQMTVLQWQWLSNSNENPGAMPYNPFIYYNTY